MNAEPRKVSQRPFERVLVWKLNHCCTTPNSCHKSFIPIFEWLTWLTLQASRYLSSDMFTRLHRDRAELGQNFSVGGYFSHITDDKDLWLLRHTQVRIKFDTATTPLWYSE